MLVFHFMWRINVCCCCLGAGAAGQGQQRADPRLVPPSGGEGGGRAGEEARVAAHPSAPGGQHEGLPRPGTAHHTRVHTRVHTGWTLLANIIPSLWKSQNIRKMEWTRNVIWLLAHVLNWPRAVVFFSINKWLTLTLHLLHVVIASSWFKSHHYNSLLEQQKFNCCYE